MKKHVLIFGLLPGVIWIAVMIVMVNLMYTSSGFESNDLLGYAAMVVVFSLIFFGVRDYRNKKHDGFISFGKALKAGVLMTLVASTIYVIVWLFYYYLFVPDFIDIYTQHVLNETPSSEFAAKTEEMESFSEMYENPLFVILITYAEVLPIGLVVALVSALILKKKDKNEEE